MLRARGVSRGKRVPPVYGEADRRPVRVQRSRATGVPGEALDAEPVQEDVGSLSVEAENVGRPFQGRLARERYAVLGCFKLRCTRPWMSPTWSAMIAYAASPSRWRIASKTSR